LKEFEYLHLYSKIHREIKAQNIPFTNNGQSKLADFDVAGQLTNTMTKRNTVIETSFWMALEVIQQIRYGVLAKLYYLGYFYHSITTTINIER
ncbi:unnamed protein product, partial [Rotaria sordida]